MNIGAFAVVTWLQHRGPGYDARRLRRSGLHEPLAALAMTIFMVSLMGVPPLLGFYAKYYVILAAIECRLLWLAIAVVLASAISAYFYLRVVAVMYFNPSDRELRKSSTTLLNAGIVVLVVANVLSASSAARSSISPISGPERCRSRKRWLLAKVKS